MCPTGSETLLSSPQSLHTCYQVSGTCSLAYFTLNRQYHYFILTVIKALRWLAFKFQTVCFANTLFLLMDNSITIYLSLLFFIQFQFLINNFIKFNFSVLKIRCLFVFHEFTLTSCTHCLCLCVCEDFRVVLLFCHQSPLMSCIKSKEGPLNCSWDQLWSQIQKWTHKMLVTCPLADAFNLFKRLTVQVTNYTALIARTDHPGAVWGIGT